MTGTTIHLPHGTWQVHPDAARDVVDVLESDAAAGRTTRLPVLDLDGTQGTLLVNAAAVAVVVLGVPVPELANGLPQHGDVKLPDPL